MGRKKPVAPDERMEKKDCPTFITSVKQDGADAGIVEAIVAVMGNVDSGDDIIHPRAFTMTIAERGSKIRVLDSHKWGSIEDSIARVLDIREIGRDELPPEILMKFPEANGGLWTRTQFLIDEPSDKSAKIFRRIKAGMVSEWSIGFDMMDDDYTEIEDESPIRNIRTVRLWEFSPVIFAMNEATATTGVKNQNGNTNSDVDPDADTDQIKPIVEAAETPDEIINDIESELADTTPIDITPEMEGVKMFEDSKELIQKLESLIEIAQGFVKELRVDDETSEQVGSDDGTKASMPAEEDAEIKRQRLLARIKEEKINA